MSTYKKLYIDPRCLRPYYETNDVNIYNDAHHAISDALNTEFITEFEKKLLMDIAQEIIKNRWCKNK
jgi:hypothetical protein